MGCTPRPRPNASAAPTSQPPALGEPARSAARQVRSSHRTTVTDRMLTACTSARVAFSHGSEAKAKAAPAMPAEVARSARCRSPMSCPLIRTTNPEASATQMP